MARMKLYVEHSGCRAYWEWAQYNPILRELLVHIPNEGKRSAIAGHLLKLIGLRPGFPDYVLFYPNKKYAGFVMEYKPESERHKKQKIAQRAWVERLLKAGYFATFAFGCDEAIQITTEYLNNAL